LWEHQRGEVFTIGAVWVETLTYGSGRASGCDSPGLLNRQMQESSPPQPRRGATNSPGFESRRRTPRDALGVQYWVLRSINSTD